MGIKDFWDLFQTLGGARHGLRISLGNPFEDAVAKKLKTQNHDAVVYQRVVIQDDARSQGRHVVDIVLINTIEQRRVLTQIEVKSRAGIAHTVAGAHTTDAKNMIRYAEALQQKYGCDEVITKVIRRGGMSIPEHETAGIITEKLESYLTDEEIFEIDTTEETMSNRIFQHAGEKGFDVYDDDVLDANLKALRDFFVETRNNQSAKVAFINGQKKMPRKQ